MFIPACKNVAASDISYHSQSISWTLDGWPSKKPQRPLAAALLHIKLSTALRLVVQCYTYLCSLVGASVQSSYLSRVLQPMLSFSDLCLENLPRIFFTVKYYDCTDVSSVYLECHAWVNTTAGKTLNLRNHQSHKDAENSGHN